MPDREVILNLWYVRDEEGVIYSLRAKAYVAEGAETVKLRFLQERSRLDYLIAEPFEIPKSFHMTIRTGGLGTKMPVSHIAIFQQGLAPITLFEEAIKALETRFPAQSNLSISQDPLICTTPLMQNANGIIEPKITGQACY